MGVPHQRLARALLLYADGASATVGYCFLAAVDAAVLLLADLWPFHGCCFFYVIPSLYKALSSEEPVERRKASACLSRIGRAVTSVQASEKEREADSNVIKDAIKPLLRFQPEAGGGVINDSKGVFYVFVSLC